MRSRNLEELLEKPSIDEAGNSKPEEIEPSTATPFIDKDALLSCNVAFVGAYRRFRKKVEALSGNMESTFLRKLGKNIKELREKRGFRNWWDLANAAGVLVHVLENLECGVGNLPLNSDLLKLAYALNTPAKRLLKDADFELFNELWPKDMY